MTNFYKDTERAVHEKPTIRRKQLISRFRLRSFKYSRFLRENLHNHGLTRSRHTTNLSKYIRRRLVRYRILVKYNKKILKLPFWKQIKAIKRPRIKFTGKKHIFYRNEEGTLSTALNMPIDLTLIPFIVNSVWSKGGVVHVLQNWTDAYNSKVFFRGRYLTRLFSNYTTSLPKLALRSLSCFRTAYKSEYTGIPFNKMSGTQMWWQLGMFRLHYTLECSPGSWKVPIVSQLLHFPQRLYNLVYESSKRKQNIASHSQEFYFNKLYYKRLVLQSYHKGLVGLLRDVKKKYKQIKSNIASKISQISKVFQWEVKKRTYKSTLRLPDVTRLRQLCKSRRAKDIRNAIAFYKQKSNWPQYRQDLIPSRYRHSEGPHQFDPSKFTNKLKKKLFEQRPQPWPGHEFKFEEEKKFQYRKRSGLRQINKHEQKSFFQLKNKQTPRSRTGWKELK
jgi:hypothetical protein